MGHKKVCDGCGEERLIDTGSVAVGMLSGIAGAFGLGGGQQQDDQGDDFGRLMIRVGAMPVTKDLCPTCVGRIVAHLNLKLPNAGTTRSDRRPVFGGGMVGALTPDELKSLGLHHIQTTELGFKCSCGEAFPVPNGETGDDVVMEISRAAMRHADAANGTPTPGRVEH